MYRFLCVPVIFSDPDVALVLITPTVKIEKPEAMKPEAMKPSLWIHSPALHFGTISLFSRSRAAVHEEASAYTQLNTKVILMQLVRM